MAAEDHAFDIDALLRMAQLSVSDEERATLTSDLDRIVAFVDALEGVDIEGIEPMVHPGADRATFRPDEARDVLGRDALKDSPHFDGEFVRVPQVVE